MLVYDLNDCHVLCTWRHIGEASPWRKVTELERQSTTLHSDSVVSSKRLPKAKLVSINVAKISIKGQEDNTSASWTPTVFRITPSLFYRSSANPGRQIEIDTLFDPTPYLMSSPTTTPIFRSEPHMYSSASLTKSLYCCEYEVSMTMEGY